MSLLNRPSDGIHSVLTVIFKLLLSEGRIERDRLVRMCAPRGSINDEKTRQTLNRWLELGLFQETADGTITLHPDVRKDERDIQKLPKLARRIVLAEQNNTDFWASEEAKAADFTRSLCWLLAQDCWSIDFAGWDQAQALIQRQLPSNAVLIQNDTRWSGLKAWVPFLGFGWSAKYPTGTLVADPTEAIRDTLPSVFGNRRTLRAADCIASLVDSLPVLDGGTYRKAVEEKLRERSGPDAWRPPLKDQLSTSFSRALLRLNEEGILTWSLRADSGEHERVYLTGRSDSSLVKDGISEFTWSPNP
jgi:hypothetical protein